MNYPGLEGTASPNIRSFLQGNLEFRNLSPRRDRCTAPCKGHLDRAPSRDGQGTLSAHPVLGDLSSGLPVAGLSHLSAHSCLISDSPFRLDGVGCHGTQITCWSLLFQLNSIFSKSRQLRYTAMVVSHHHREARIHPPSTPVDLSNHCPGCLPALLAASGSQAVTERDPGDMTPADGC